MTHQEQEVWKLLQDSELLAPARFRDSNGMVFWNWAVLEDMVFPMLRRHWSELMSAYTESTEAARKWVDKTESDVSSGIIYSGIKKIGTLIPKQQPQPAAYDDFDDDLAF